MASEKELISKLQELRRVKPNKDWAFSLKTSILGEQKTRMSLISDYFRIPYLKPALVALTSVFLLFGTFSFVQNSVPGDSLYPVKKFVEKGQLVFVPEEDKSQFNLNLLDKRMEELVKIAETNQVKNLSSAITEVEMSISKATKSLSENPDAAAAKEIVNKIDEKVQAVRSLSIVLKTEELDEMKEKIEENEEKSEAKIIAEDLISNLGTLTEEQEEVLSQMKDLVEQEKYEEAINLFDAEFDKTGEDEETEEE